MDAGTRLALDRTALAHERTLMAWVRTAVSLISFGFTIYKFFNFELQSRPPLQGEILGPRGFAFIMIAVGVFALIVAMFQHRHSLVALHREYGQAMPKSLAVFVAALFGMLGLLALTAVIMRR